MRTQRLEPRARPTQKRAGQTVDLILTTAAKLLEENGFEELTTNKICTAAGITPPALYRYFPNKYALLCELATRLMAAQNADLAQTAITKGGARPTVADMEEQLAAQVRITRAFPGGVAIMRTLYATPQLIDIRLSSHWSMVDGLKSSQTWLAARMSEPELIRRLRLAVELGNSAIEMVLEDPDLDEASIIHDVAEMIVAYLTKT
ncbi:TetR/AcrR family transcriptional regulator [Ruegeria sp. HKCCD8929]|uniref:TetR/AcrR family transcriptional regulator n=1 Tax=Ruegeria sp. HKCCD8929 TaxID=2683006 RepID=UPI00148896DB|nr:TetR/AcrR family transcriptional regulator [Ruegeria sp. HKCCD8929]